MTEPEATVWHTHGDVEMTQKQMISLAPLSSIGIFSRVGLYTGADEDILCDGCKEPATVCGDGIWFDLYWFKGGEKVCADCLLK